MSSDQVPSFVDLGDGRIISGGLQLDMAKKRKVSTSFTAEWKCLRCPQHNLEPALKMRGAADSSCHQQAIVLADQSFPAVMPVSGPGGCLKIILVESGSLDALYEELVKQVGNRRIPPGTLIMAFSASHLANIGIGQYTRDLVSIANKIAVKYGSETIFQPLPPQLLGGTDSKLLIRPILELIAWSNSYYVGDNYLEESQLRAKCILLEMGEGEQEIPAVMRYALPVKNRAKDTRVWASGGQESQAMPDKVKALTANMECEYVKGMARARMGIDLEANPIVERTMGTQMRPKRKVDVLLVGSSYASNLATALRARGKTVVDVMESPLWTISRSSVQEMAGQVKAAIAKEDPYLVIFQLIDNSSFYVRGNDGSRQLPKKTGDDYHLEGELFVCARETQFDHLRTLRPLFESVGKKHSLWLAPMPRYVVAGCCTNPRHAPNRADPYFQDDMSTQLDTFKRNIKDHIHNLQRKNIKVVDPNLDIRGMDPADIWADDPIHPREEAPKKIAGGILLMASKFNERPPEQQQQR
jgi:hypothetical protein